MYTKNAGKTLNKVIQHEINNNNNDNIKRKKYGVEISCSVS